ncbi:MAG TPA: quinohemoprotein amine dehydrogenase subunit alpha [Planctomycetota bacterium]|nr:quinohemoprotein amine dehydrogenase subunit alpha [Planctomycetota bacterium]
MTVPSLLLAGLCLLSVRPSAQQPATPPAPPAPVQAPAAPQDPPATTPPPTGQEPRARRGRRGGAAGGAEQDPEGNEQEPQTPADTKPKAPRRGIPVDDLLVHTHCVRCHALDEKNCMTRISYERKSPEGWAESIKRMGRLYGLQLSPTDAKQLVRSLANSHGLARSEAERALYYSERRVHWSEEQHDQDFKRACAQCHTLGRVLLQQRDAEEWQLLRATHVAMFPLSRGQMGGGPPEEPRRRGGGQAPAPAAPVPAEGGTGRGRPGDGPPGGSTQSVGDRVLQKLTADQPLFSPAWESWTKNRREVPLAGTWTVFGHETGRGDLVGTAELRRSDADEYEVSWRLAFADGTTVQRAGRGFLYAGYSWRGRSQDPGPGGASWREVLLLDDSWQDFHGRLFTGDYDEIGVDVTLARDQRRPRVLALGNAAIAVPSTGHRLDVYGEVFPTAPTAADFFVGAGLTVTAVERRSDRHVVLVLDAAPGAELGPRTVAYGSEPGSAWLQLYDTVDYVRIRPLQGFARVGGVRMPKQLERFEAFAVHRGPDEKPFTDDDVDLFQVRPRWGLAEFRVREDDDDLAFVGSIDATTGVFTPANDGPNPSRQWQANNVGDVFVTAEVELDVAVRPPKPKPEQSPPDKPGEKPGEKPAAAAAQPAPAPAAGPPGREHKTFLARSHLIVSVPLFVRWQVLDWEDR